MEANKITYKELLSLIEEKFKGRIFSLKGLLNSLPDFRDDFNHSSKVVAILKKLEDKGKLKGLENNKFQLIGETKMKANKVSRITASCITDSIKEVKTAEMISSLVAEEITKSVQDTAPVVEPKKEDPSKAMRYMERGTQEVNNLISDLNFELNDSLSNKSVKVAKISLPEDGTAVIEIQKTMTIKDPEVAKNVGPKARMFSLRPEFAKYVTYNVSPPAPLSSEVIINIKIVLPPEVVSDLVGGPGNENWGKAVKAVENYGKQLAKNL